MARANYQKPDHYARRAKDDGYLARSVYKLQEIDRSERLFKPGMKVLDLGAAPGSWMQYAGERVGPAGLVAGVDLSPLGRSLKANERFIQADAFKLEAKDAAPEGGRFDLVLSDMMANTSGNQDTDHFRSIALAERALVLAEALLRPGGNFLVKVFQGPDFEAYRKRLRLRFRTVKVKKPKSSRPTSREVYLLGLEKIRGQGGG
jgi:23S rRNA (uridine2552-2'-O)-methyltransferase